MTELVNLLSQLSGREFEHFIGDLWAARGWDVDVTAQSGDDGADVVVQRHDYYQQKKLIQAKCVQPDDRLSRSTVQQYSYLLHGDTDEALLVTTGGFTEGARQSAAKVNLKLIGGETLEQLVFDTLETTESAFDAAAYVPEYDFDSDSSHSESPDTDSVLTADDGSVAPETIPADLRSRVDRLSEADEIYDRLLATVGHSEFGIDTRLLMLFQLFRGDDPFDVLFITDATVSYRPLLNRIVDLQQPKPTEHINCRRTDVDTVIGRPEARGGCPGLLSELDDGLLVMSEFSENDTLRGELVEPLQSGTVRSAKHGRTEAAAISTSVLAVGTPKDEVANQHEDRIYTPVGEQLAIGIKSFSSFDGVVQNHVNADIDTDVTTKLPAVHTHTTATTIADQVFKAYRVVANTLDPDVPDNVIELLDQIESKVNEVQDYSSVLAASAVTASLLRGAKASARIRLRDSVCKDDIRRASVVLPWFLVGGDLGEIIEDPVGYTVGSDFDAEVVETGVSKQPANLKGVIAEVAEEYEKGAPIEVVLQRATEIGLDATKAEQEIEKLRRKGEVYEQHQDHLRTT